MRVNATDGSSANAKSPTTYQRLSEQWASALADLPGDLRLTKALENKFDPGPRARIVALIGKETIPPARWQQLDEATRIEVGKLFAKAGIAPEQATRRPRGASQTNAADKEPQDKVDIDLNWAGLRRELPFNIYYNSIHPGSVRRFLDEHLRTVEALLPAASFNTPKLYRDWKKAAKAYHEKVGEEGAVIKLLAQNLDPRELPEGTEPLIVNALIYFRIRETLDPNRRPPLTNSEWRSLNDDQKLEVLSLLKLSGFSLAHFNRPQRRTSTAGRAVAGTAVRDSGIEDHRVHEHTSAIVSKENIVDEVLSHALGGKKEGTFDHERIKLLRGAKRFFVARYYGFESMEFAKEAVAAAKRGAKGEIEIQPPKTASHRARQEQVFAYIKAEIDKHGLQDRLAITEAEILPHREGVEFPQIMHEKSIIADTEDGTLVEIEGGINGGTNSPNNLDFAMRIEGVAVLDSLRKYLSVRSKHHEHAFSVAEEIIAHYPREDLAAAVLRVAKKRGVPLCKIALGGTGERFIPQAETYDYDSLLKRAEAGLAIHLGLEDVVAYEGERASGRPGYRLLGEDDVPDGSDRLPMDELLTRALQNGSYVTVTVPTGHPTIDQEHYEVIKAATEPLRTLGAHVAWDDTRVRDVSYRNLFIGELDRAIERLDSYQGAFFAFTHPDVLDRVRELHRAHDRASGPGHGQVRLAVDALEIENEQVNAKVIALTTAGVPVHVFTDLDAVDIAARLSKELKVDITPEQIKLHAKVALLGAETGPNQLSDPRALHGSANASMSGFERNVEGGRCYYSDGLVQRIQSRVLDEIFSVCREVEEFRPVPLAQRVPLLPDIPLDTPIENIRSHNFDTETTGFSAPFGAKIIELGAVAGYFKKSHETVDGKRRIRWSVDFDRLRRFDSLMRLENNPFGLPDKVPERAARIHGRRREDLEGAPGAREALSQFAEFVLEGDGPKILSAHNAPFDIGVLDSAYSEPGNSVRGINYEVASAPVVCTMAYAKWVKPFKKKEEREPGERAQSYKLDTLNREYGTGWTQGEEHYASEDALGAMILHAELLTAAQAETYGDMLAVDRLAKSPMEFQLSEDADGKTPTHRFKSEGIGHDPRLAVIWARGQSGDEALGPARKIYDCNVVETQGHRVKLEFRMTTGKRKEHITGWADADQVRWYQAGKCYYELRESGLDLQIPLNMSRGEVWRNESGSLPLLRERLSKDGDAGSEERARIEAQIATIWDSLQSKERLANQKEGEAERYRRLAAESSAIASDARAEAEELAERIDTLRSMLQHRNQPPAANQDGASAERGAP